MGGSPRATAATQFRYSLLLREIDELRARGSASVALLLVELSGIGEINGRFGYLGGDRLLEELGQRLRSVVRPQDRVLALTSRSFAMLIDNPLHESHAVLAAGRVAQAATGAVAMGADRARARVRIGVALLAGASCSGEELLRHGEAALQSARSREESYVLFSPSLLAAPAATTDYTWFEIEEALKAGEFELFYQPQIDLRTGRLAGAEALVRWNHPRAGHVSPAAFMPVIERSGGVRALLWFVLNSALRQAAAWSMRQPGFSVSVNLAAGNLVDPDLVDIVENALDVWSLPAGQLTLELTESSLMQSPVASAQVMGQLRDLGTRTSIDDFGTGYSSLAYLRDLPADELKIDRAFVGRILGAERDRDIVASIVQLAHAVKLKVVAEGIEERAAQMALAAMACDFGQGYHFGAPIAVQDFERSWIDVQDRHFPV